MFSEEIENYIIHGKEEINIEYKSSMSWSINATKLKIIQALLALSNTQDGGVVVIGVGDDGVVSGMTECDYNSYDYDDISKVLNSYTDPKIKYELLKNLNKDGKKIVVFQVRESPEIVICVKSGFYNSAKGYESGNVVFRENGVYIRSSSPVESREVKSAEEWRELINRCIEKTREKILKKLPCVGMFATPALSDSQKFNNDLIDDSL